MPGQFGAVVPGPLWSHMAGWGDLLVPGGLATDACGGWTWRAAGRIAGG